MLRLGKTQWRPGRANVAAGLAVGLLVVPAARLAGSPVNAPPITTIEVLAATAVGATLGRTFSDGSPPVRIAGTLAFLVSLLLVDQASYPGSGFVVAILAGTGLGMLLPRERLLPGTWWPAAAVLVAASWFLPSMALIGVAAASAVASFAGLVRDRDAGSFSRWQPRVAVGWFALWGLFSVFWVGSTAPGVTWFGSLTAHGSRSTNQVAVSFDDGPNGIYTLQIAQILEDHGARGTFFEVGKAIRQQPDVTKELIARGHTVGNHSYNHGAVSYLDPFYPELDQTQEEFAKSVGTCPVLFRPPHGTHTPFMSHIVTSAHMRLINWDVSAQDWVEDDPTALTANILKKVKPGSIILLHDGLDGNPGADRSVVVKALNGILDGLKAKGYEVVTVDKLLALQPYQACGG